MSGDKGEFKGKARSGSRAGMTVPEEINIRYYGMWKKENSSVGNLVREAREVPVGSNAIAVRFELGKLVEFTPPKKVVFDFNNIIYIFYDVSNKLSFDEAAAFLQAQVDKPRSNSNAESKTSVFKGITSRLRSSSNVELTNSNLSNVHLIADNSSSKLSPQVSREAGLALARQYGIHFHECLSNKGGIQQILSDSLEKYVISVSSPEAGQQIRIAKAVMEQAHAKLDQLLTDSRKAILNSKELQGILEKLNDVKNLIKDKKNYCFDKGLKDLVLLKISQLQEKILSLIHEAALAGPSKCDLSLYVLYINYCSDAHFWEDKIASYSREINENKEKFNKLDKADEKGLSGINDPVRNGSAAYTNARKVILDLQTIAAAYPSAILDPMRENCASKFTTFVSSVSKEIGNVSRLSSAINAIEDLKKATLQSLDEYLSFKKTYLYFQPIFATLSNPNVAEERLQGILNSGAILLESRAREIRIGHDKYLADLTEKLVQVSKVEIDFNTLFSAEDVFKARSRVEAAKGEILSVQQGVNKYRKSYGDSALVSQDADLNKETTRIEMVSFMLTQAEELLEMQEKLNQLDESLRGLKNVKTLQEALTNIQQAKELRQQMSSLPAQFQKITQQGLPLCAQSKSILSAVERRYLDTIEVLEKQRSDFVMKELSGLVNSLQHIKTTDIQSLEKGYELINQAKQLQDRFAEIKKQFPANADHFPKFLQEADGVIAELIGKAGTVAWSTHMQQPKNIEGAFQCARSKNEMEEAFLYDNGHSYEKGTTVTGTKPLSKNFKLNELFQAYLKFQPIKKVLVDGASEKPVDSKQETRSAEEISFIEDVLKILECPILTIPILVTFANNSGWTYQNTSGILAREKDPLTNIEVTNRINNYAMQNFINTFFEVYPEQLARVADEWATYKDKGDAPDARTGVLEFTKWLFSLRISLLEKEKYLKLVYEKAGLTAIQLQLELDRFRGLSNLNSLDTPNKLIALLTIQRHVLPILHKLMSDADKAGGKLPENAKESIDAIGKIVGAEITKIISAEATKQQSVSSSLIVSPLQPSFQQRASSSNISSLFSESKERNSPVMARRSSVTQDFSFNSVCSSSQFPKPVSDNKLTAASPSNNQQVAGDPGAISVTTTDPSQQLVGDSSHFSSSADQLPAGNSLNS